MIAAWATLSNFERYTEGLFTHRTMSDLSTESEPQKLRVHLWHNHAKHYKRGALLLPVSQSIPQEGQNLFSMSAGHPPPRTSWPTTGR